MSPGQALALGLVVVLVVLLTAAYIWYNFGKWDSFEFSGATPYNIGGKSAACGAGEACIGGLCKPKCDAATPCASGDCVSGYCAAPGFKPCCDKGYTFKAGRCLQACDQNNPCDASAPHCQKGVCMASAIPQWPPKAALGAGKTVASLRFKDCAFTLTGLDGQAHTVDVTPVLNGMAAAYRGSSAAAPKVLQLDRPLNAFSFVVPGVNDAASYTDDQLKLWGSAATSLTGTFRVL